MAKRPRKPPPDTGKQIKGFISYAHNDLRMLERLLVYLDDLTRAFDITFWHDDSIDAGAHWNKQIEAAINASDLFLLLTSPSSLASPYIQNRELPAIVKRANAVGGKVVPIVLMPCAWQSLSRDIQALPMHARRLKPITEWRRHGDGYAAAVAQLHKAVARHFNLTPKTDSPLDALIGERSLPGDPVLEPLDGQLDLIGAGSDADVSAIASPIVRTLHAAVRDAASRFLERVQRLGNRLDQDWDDLIPAAQALADALNRPLTALPEDILGLWLASTALGSFLGMDRDLHARQSTDPEPLPPAVARALSDLVNRTALFVREFPSALGFDDKRGGFFAHPELLPPATDTLRAARDQQVLTPAASDTLEKTLDAARRDPAQGGKAGAFGLSGTQGVLSRGGSFVAEHDIAQAGGPDPARVLFEQRFEAFLEQARPYLGPLLASMPSDIGHAMEVLVERAGTDAFPGKAGGGGKVSVPPQPPAEPPPDFDPERVREMVLAGERVPDSWVPFVTTLQIGVNGSFLGAPRFDDLRPLARFTALRELYLNYTQVSDVSPLAGLSALQTLHLRGTGVSDVSRLAGLSALQHLYLNGTSVSDVSPLAGLSALQFLNLDRTGVSDVSPLAGLSALQTLYLQGTSVSDVSPLAGLSSLQVLDLRGTGVSDVSPLAGLSSLQRLDLDRRGVSDVSPLRHLTNLKITR